MSTISSGHVGVGAPSARNGFYHEAHTEWVNGEGYNTYWRVCYNSPYRLGCFIADCSSPAQASALAAALNATLNLRGL